MRAFSVLAMCCAVLVVGSVHGSPTNNPETCSTPGCRSPVDADEASLLASGLRRTHMRAHTHTAAEEDTSATCPGSPAACNGNQCCPAVAQSGWKTFPCPNAEPGWNQCESAPADPKTTCLGSSAACNGNQCCPGVAESCWKTFPCPNAEPGFNQCESIPVAANTFDCGLTPVIANDLTFDCRFAGHGLGEGKKGDVMLLHGFPEWSSMYISLMRELAKVGYHSVACDQRGYSPGASPEKEEDYNYNLLRDDIFAAADALKFDKFHLIAHDHGAILGWYAADSKRGEDRFLSYTAMSIPHNDAFSAGLYGPDADAEQQMASQYFSIFTMPNSASMKNYTLFNTMGWPAGFDTSSHFQKALWWYNGAFDVGVLAMPPSYSAQYLASHGSIQSAAMREYFGGDENDGLPQKVATGQISMPTLYVCGTDDTFILCDHEYARNTKNFCKKDYQHLPVACGHFVLACDDQESTDKVIAGIINRVVTATPAK